MAIATNGTTPAPAGIHRWGWAIAILVGLSVQTGILIGVMSGWRGAVDAAIADYGRRLLDLEKSDREGAQLPSKIDEIAARLTRLEARDEEARRLDRQTAERLVRVEAALAGLSDQARQVISELRDLRAERRGSSPYRAGDPPAFRPN